MASEKCVSRLFIFSTFVDDLEVFDFSTLVVDLKGRDGLLGASEGDLVSPSSSPGLGANNNFFFPPPFFHTLSPLNFTQLNTTQLNST